MSSLSCPIICVLSLVLSHISCVTVLNVSLLSVMVRVSSVKCLMSCPMICVSFGLSCPISLVPLHCDVSLLSVRVRVSLVLSCPIICVLSCPIIQYVLCHCKGCVSAECRGGSDECPA